MDGPVLAIEQRAGYSRAVVFSRDRRVLAAARESLRQIAPAPGRVEFDPDDIWTTVIATARAALVRARVDPSSLAAIGVAAQRETTLLWDRATGRPVYRAVGSADRRSLAQCRALVTAGVEPLVRERTGLRLDPMFAAPKLAWLLDNLDGMRGRAESGALAFGTVDSYLLWRMTDGRVHATDVTNAARTMLFNIRRRAWDDDLLRVFDIPEAVLPQVHDTVAYFGAINAAHLGGSGPISIQALIGDQQATLVGQGCLAPGMTAVTFDTECAALRTTAEAVPLPGGLLTTIAWQHDGRASYALEGMTFPGGGTAIDWLGARLRLIAGAAEAERLAAAANPSTGVYLVPAFAGLGAPHWDDGARGAVVGVTADCGLAELALAGLESLAYQIRDLLEAMDNTDGSEAPDPAIRVGGDIAASDWTMQLVADLLGRPVDRPVLTDHAALGVAWLAALGAGLGPSEERFAAGWVRDRRFQPQMPADHREQKYAGWKDAVRRVRSGD